MGLKIACHAQETLGGDRQVFDFRMLLFSARVLILCNGTLQVDGLRAENKTQPARLPLLAYRSFCLQPSNCLPE
jgi:hypothetical protein